MVNLEGKCVWKTVAEKDKEKMERGVGPITLSEDKPCHDCDGYDIECKAYRASKKKG